MNFYQVHRGKDLADGATFACLPGGIVVHIERIGVIDSCGVIISHGKVASVGKDDYDILGRLPQSALFVYIDTFKTTLKHTRIEVDKVEILLAAKRFTPDQIASVLDLTLCCMAPVTVEFGCMLDNTSIIQQVVSFVDEIHGVGTCDLLVEPYKEER